MAHRLQNIYAKSESSPGTQIAIGATDTLECDSFVIRNMGDPIVRRPIKTNLGGEQPAPVQARWCEIDLNMECKVTTNATTAPEWGRILRAAGMSETIAANVIYAPQADANGAATDYSLTCVGECDLDGNTYATFGTRFGSLEFSGRDSERLMLAAKGIGAYAAVIDQPALTSPTSYGTLPFTKATTFSIHSYSPKVQEWSLSIPIEVSRRIHYAGTAANGYCVWPSFVTWNGNPILSLTCEAEDQTAFAVFSKWAATTIASGSIVLSDGTRTCTFTLGAMAFNAPEVVDSDSGPQLYRLTAVVCRTGSTPSVTITTA